MFGFFGDSDGDGYSGFFSDDKEIDGFLTYMATHPEDDPFVDDEDEDEDLDFDDDEDEDDF
jgi:hypothetical protein